MRTLSRLLLLLGLSLGVAAAQEKKIVFLGDAKNEETRTAIAAAVDEAEAQASFLDIEYLFVVAQPGEAAEHDDAMAVIIAASPAEILKAADALADAQVPVFNVSSADDRLRIQCRPNLFHVPPSAKMLADAEAQWRKANPEAKDVKARAWHAEFVKFSARELNRRWEEATGRPMSDADWAVWAAYKLVSDAIANNPEAGSEELIAYFREDMEFDSVKGVESTFRETGQLRQPLLVVVDGKLVGEAPVRGVAQSDDLDSLGGEQCQP
jgi:ABC-type branched-subunit amino acid transport system substrate-binding protein